VEQLGAEVSLSAACSALGVPRATFYRRKRQPQRAAVRRRKPARSLSVAERQRVLGVLHQQRFVDMAPAEVYTWLLEKETYLCSIRTMYRILEEVKETTERRSRVSHPSYTKPELLATGPNQVWSWDITKLNGPGKWQHYYLYVIMDIFSRYVVGWMIADRESAILAQRFIADTLRKEQIEPDQLVIHADRGAAMRSKPVVQLLAEIGVTRTHSRPHCSNDNPYSEAQFKTLKYRPDFPQRFGSLEDAKTFCRGFFRWYNRDHYHSGIALLTPVTVHTGRAEDVIRQRSAVLEAAYQAHPERFIRKRPTHSSPPAAAWINPPTPKTTPNSCTEVSQSR
jgi:putative transposase